MPGKKPRRRTLGLGGGSKWWKRRIARNAARERAGKKPLAQPLIMSEEGVVGKHIVLLDGKKRIKVKMEKDGILQGVYKTGDGRVIVVRFKEAEIGGLIILRQFLWGYERQIQPAFFTVMPDLAHMMLPGHIQEMGLGTRILSKADRHIRNQLGGENVFHTDVTQFDRILKRIGYQRSGETSVLKRVYWKTGQTKETDNMGTFHRIEAIDQRTGRARAYVFPVKGEKKK